MDTTALVVLMTLFASPADSQHHSGSEAPLATLSTLQAALHALEIKTEALDAKLGAVISAVSTLQATITTLESKIGATVTNDSSDALQSTVEHHQEKLNAMASNTGSRVYFRASFRKDLTLIKKGRVKFDLVVENAGNAYNPSFGIFTAPVRGLYVFTAQIFTSGAEDVNLELQVVDVVMRTRFIPIKQASSAFVHNTYLQVGEEVFVNNKGPHVISGISSSFFSGWLVRSL